MLGFWGVFAPLAALTAMLAAAAVARHGKGPGNLGVKLSGDTFIHEKVYLCEGRAITGSANLTYSGLHRNLEHVEVIVARDRLEGLAAHFGGLWDSLS